MAQDQKKTGLAQFDEIGGLVSTTAVAREIEFEGKKATFYFRELPYSEVEKALTPSEGKSTNLAFLCATLTGDESGADRPSIDQIDRIKPKLFRLLLDAAFEVNGVGKKVEDAAGNSTAEPSSGTS